MNVQQEVELVVFSDEECDSILGGKPHPTNICAGVPEGGKGQCSVNIIFMFIAKLPKKKCQNLG